MKTRVRLLGKGLVIQCDSLDRSDDFLWYNLITEGVELAELVDDGEWEYITKKKGKYVKGKLIREQIEPVFGDEILFDCQYDVDFDFEFEIEHEGEFNPKLIQLLKSDYEFDDIPYGIIADVILYDGKKIPSITMTDISVNCNNTRKVTWDGFYYSSASID